MKRLSILLAVLLTSHALSALAATTDNLILAKPDVAAALAADAARQGPQPYRFAVPIPVLISPQTHGAWSTLADGRLRWRMNVAVPEAKHLNLGFTAYSLPPGAALTVSAPDGSGVRGPYTSRGNANGQLWTPVVMGSEVLMELTLPAASLPAVTLALTRVNYGFRGFGAQDETAEAKSGACNVDVACPEGDEWRDEIRSVARYSIAGALLCSGQLVNNTARDFTPYFLTASHCVPSHALAPTTVYYWNYETTPCGRRSPNGSLSQTQSGALMVATSGAATAEGSDFSLLQLLETPDPAFAVYYAGWDNRDIAPNGVTGIHHPSGDEKRISFDFDQTELALYLDPGSPDNSAGTHIRVIDWDIGTTEGGSSGSGIWNNEHRLVGTLSGGYAACGNDDSDWYGRFNKHWHANPTPLTSVESWLDPSGEGAEVLDGADPNCPADGCAPKAGSGSGAILGGALPPGLLLALLSGVLIQRRRLSRR